MSPPGTNRAPVASADRRRRSAVDAIEDGLIQAHAADRRHRGSHRPRQDVAGARADRQGHRPPAGGAAARDLDRPRLRAARASRRPAALARRRAGPRALRPQHGRGRDRDRPLPARDRRRRGRAAADPRAPGDPAPARDRPRRGRGDEGGRGRRGDARAALAEAARARPRGRGRRRQRQDRRGARRAARRARPGRGGVDRAHDDGADPPVRRPRRSRCAGSAPSSPARSGRGRSARATSCGSSRPAWTCACGASRCTTARSSGPRRASGSRSRSRASSATGSRAATRWSRRAPTPSPTGSTSRSRSSDDVPAAVTVHLGTADVPARVARSGRYAQLRLERPVVAARGDRVVLRTRSTVGGGVVLDPAASAAPRPRAARAARARRGRSDGVRAGPRRDAQPPRRARGRRACRRLGLLARLARGAARADDERRSRRPTRATPGSTPPSAPWAAAIVPLLGLERRGSRLYAPGATAQVEGADELLAELEASGFDPVKVDDAGLARALEQEGKLVRLGDDAAVGARRVRAGPGGARRRVHGSRRDHARALPRPARDRPPRGAAPARALRRRRGHPPDGRPSRPPPRRTMTFWIALALVVFARRRGRVGARC